jgi:predicted  nucleic acid-binding Zn-ribbon protein
MVENGTYLLSPIKTKLILIYNILKEQMERKILPYLVVISALSVSLSAAFYSVTGLGKMFSGASVQVMIMMTSLEIAKLVLASLLYQYWSRLNKALKTYYFVALFVLMSITSAGIYGYLSSAYSDTLNKVEIIDKQVKVLDTKREMFQTQLNDARVEKERLNQNIAELTKGVSNNFIQTKDKQGNVLTTTSSANRKVYEEQLKVSQARRDDIFRLETVLGDSIRNIDLKKLDLETNTDVAGEVGPLKYISKLTGKTMDQVINWFIIALMLVFDPLAVSLVVGANVIFRDKKKEEEKLKLSKEIDQKIIQFEERKLEVDKINEDLDKRILNIDLKEIESVQRINQLEEDTNIRLSNSENDLNKKEEDIKKLELQTIQFIDDSNKKFKIKEDTFDSFVKTEKEKLQDVKSKLDLKDQDLEIREKNYKELILKEEQELKEKLKIQADKIKSEWEDLKKQKKEFQSLKKKITEEKEDLEDLKVQLDNKNEDLLERENILEKVKEELLNLDSEIKSWESKNTKMRRMQPPPSAI